MRTNKELRQEAWNIVHGRWFLRLLLICILLQGIGPIVSSLAPKLVVTGDFTVSKLGAYCLQMLFSLVFGGIAAFGISSSVLKAVRNEDERWFADSMGGFSHPLSVAWLLLSIQARVLLWSLLFIVPGIIATYRYRQSWYLKSEHPDWSAAECIAESSKMMDGYKWKAVCYDFSYLGWFLLAGLFGGVGVALSRNAAEGGVLFSALASLVGLITVYFFCLVIIYFIVGRAVFYQEMIHLANKPMEDIEQ